MKARGGDGERSRCGGLLVGRLKVGLYMVSAIAVSAGVTSDVRRAEMGRRRV